MIYSKTQKIMRTGINKYSKVFGIDANNTQILIKNNESEEVSYTMCNDWQPKLEVSFKDIMDVKVDLLGFEGLASPFLAKSVVMYAHKYETTISNINLFIFEKNKKMGVAVYENTDFKEAIPLEKQFERLNI